MPQQKPQQTAPEQDQMDVYPRPSDETGQPQESNLGDEFQPTMGFGRGTAPPVNLEKDYGPYNPPAATAEELFRTEQDLIKSLQPSPATIITMKEEEEETRRADEQMEELMRMRENPVSQPPRAQLPPSSLPPGSPPSVSPHMPPQVPGAATYPNAGTQPTAPMNPFAGYRQEQPQQMKPESGLPWKPPQAGGGGGFGKSFKAAKHDCKATHPGMKHEAWETKKEEDYAKLHPSMSKYQDHPGENCSDAHPGMAHENFKKIVAQSFRKKMFTANSLPNRETGENPVPLIDHDCITVHGYQNHDDWQVEQYAREALAESKYGFFRP